MMPITRGTNKHLLEIGGVSLLEHSIDLLVGCGLKKVIVVSNPNGYRKIANILERYAAVICVEHIVQWQYSGTAHAIVLALRSISDSNLVILFADNYFTELQDIWPPANGNEIVLFRKKMAPHYDVGTIQVEVTGLVTQLSRHQVKINPFWAMTGLIQIGRPLLNSLEKYTEQMDSAGSLEQWIETCICKKYVTSRIVNGDWLDVCSSLSAYNSAKQKFEFIDPNRKEQ